MSIAQVIKRYTNVLFTYLLTYLVTYLLTYLFSEHASVCSAQVLVIERIVFGKYSVGILRGLVV